MAVDSRLPDTHRVPRPGAQFRCDVCRRFVTTTPHGVCPGCGRAPLSLAVRASRVAESIPWIYVLGVAALLGALVLLAW